MAIVHGEVVRESAVERATPWISSFLMHAGLGLVAAFVVFAAIARTPIAETSIPLMIPEALDVQNDAKPALDESAVGADAQWKATQIRLAVNSDGLDSFGSIDILQKTVSGLSDSTGDPIEWIGPGHGGDSGSSNALAGRDGPGKIAAWGPSMKPGADKTIFSLPPSAKKIVYILDHSGSMLDTFDFLRQEAIRSVNNMLPVQQFSVVMVSEKASAIFPDLQRATTGTKREFAARLASYRAQGMNDDLLAPFQDAFEKAFAMNPDVIYFLTDGHFDPQLAQVVDRLNQGKQVRVNTMAYVTHDASYEEQLQKMAKRHHGTYKFVSVNDLGR